MVELRPDRALVKAVDQALTVESGVVKDYVAWQRRRRPSATPAEVVSAMNKQFLASMTGTGAAAGAAAAAPGVGAPLSLAMSAGDVVGFLGASALLALATAEVHGLEIEDVERRRTLLLAVVLGDSGAAVVSKAAERTGQHWGRALVRGIPTSSLTRVNKVLGRHFVTKFGTKEGIIVLGRVLPFGIGAAIGGGGNALLARSTIAGTGRAFGPPPEEWLQDASTATA